MTVTRLACGLLFLAAAFQAAPAGADGALASYQQFHVIKHDLSESQDHSAECTKRLGRGFRLADWNDLVAYHDGGGSLAAFADGLKMSVEGGDSRPGDIAAGYRISRDGNEIWSGRRHYFFARHNHRKPSYFGAHAHLDNYYLSLGSWYGTGGHMLCYGTGSGSGGALLFADDFASGNTGRWDVAGRGPDGGSPAPGRLAVEGGVLKINATAGGNYSVGVRKDIAVDGASGGYSLSFDWKAVTRETPWGLDGVRLYLYDRQDRRIGSLVAINSGQTRRGGNVLVHVCGQEDLANRRCNGIGKLAETFDWERVSLDTAMIPGMDPDNVVRVEIHAWVYNDAGSGGEIHVDNFELRGENGGTGGGFGPDLVVESPRSTESSVAPRGTLRFGATVRNQGKSRSGTTTLRYYRSSDSRITTSDTPVGTDRIGELSPSATDRQSIGQRVPSTPGTYYYGACVDSVSGESDTGNNCSSGVAVKVEGADDTGPDLVVESPRSTESSVAPRGTLRFGATVRNQGESRSGATTLRYYRSSDSRITTSDTPVGTDRIGALSPSATDRQSIGQRVPSTPGTYYYGACVDSVSGESDTGNNCSSGVAVKVEGDVTGPDLVVESPRSTKSSVAPRGTLRFGATVRNRGKSRSGATILRYYRSSDSRITTSDTPVGTDRIGALSPSATDRQSIGQRVPSTPGWYYYGACVEPVTGESDTGNNCSSGIRVQVGDETPPAEKVEVRVSLFGGGTVDVVGRGDLNCPVERLCSGYFPANGSLTLRAVDPPGYALDNWLGCDSVSGADCKIELHSDRLVSAEFLSTQPLQLKDNVVSFDESRLDDIEQYDPQSGVMVLSAGATTNDIEVGSVLMSSVSDPERSFESAFLRRVTDLSQASGSSVQLKTTHATVEDLILAGSLALRRDLGASEVAAYELPAGLTPISHPASELTVRELPGGRRIFEVLGTDGQPRSVATPLSSTRANAEQTVTGSIVFRVDHPVADGLKATGTISLTAEPTFLLDVGFPGGFREFKGQVRIIASSELKIEVSQDLFHKTYTQKLKGLRIKFNKPPPTFGPVVIVPEIEVDLYLKVSLKAGFEPTFTLAAEATAGAHYLRGEGWSGIWDFKRTFDVDVPSGIELRANAEAGALVWLNTRVYDLVGPKIGIGPFLGADVFALEEPRGPCKWDYELYLGGQAQYGGEAQGVQMGLGVRKKVPRGTLDASCGKGLSRGSRAGGPRKGAIPIDDCPFDRRGVGRPARDRRCLRGDVRSSSEPGYGFRNRIEGVRSRGTATQGRGSLPRYGVLLPRAVRSGG